MSELKAIQVSQSEMAVRLASAFHKTSKPEVDPDIAMSELMRSDAESAKRWLAAAEVAILYMGECLGAQCEFLGPVPDYENPADVGISPRLRGKKVQA